MEKNEAIEVVKRNYPHVTESGSQFEIALRSLIPELAESEDEDERIRNNCIHFLDLQKSHHASTIEINECINWLEALNENQFVYVVTRCEEHSDYVEKAFLYKEKAEDYCKQFNENEDCYRRHITKVKID